MDREEILSKIRKMKALVEDPTGNEHEQATAYRMMQAMLVKYQVELHELGQIEDDQVVTIEVEVPERIRPWRKILSGAIAHGMECEVIITHGRTRKKVLMFMGHASDVEVAIYLFEMLSTELQRCGHKTWADKDMHLVVSKNKFMNGYGIATSREIKTRLVEARKEAVEESDCTAMVVVRGDEVSKYVKQKFPMLKFGRTKSYKHGELDGMIKGQNVSLNKALTK